MRKLFIASFIYLVLGLAAGVFYREFTKFNNFEQGEFTQLSVVHTHILTLGFLAMLVFLALEKLFSISNSQGLFTTFFWLNNTGLVISTGMMVVHGSLTVLGTAEVSPAISGIAGLGHMILSAGLVIFMVALGQNLNLAKKTEGE